MRRVFLLFSHDLSPEQRQELEEKWQAEEIVFLPEDLQHRWSNIPPHLENIAPYLEPVFNWLAEEAKAQDLALIHGDFGAVYLAVERVFKLGLVPIYATTRRELHERRLPDGSIRQERIFKHVRFRIYGR